MGANENQCKADAAFSELGIDTETIRQILFDIVLGMSITEGDMDVRLVVRYDLSEWEIMTGSSDYDQWHGHCGAASVSGIENYSSLESIAEDLI